MKLTESQIAEIMNATGLSRPTIYKVLKGHETTSKATEYIVKLAYLDSLKAPLTRDWIDNLLFEVNEEINNFVPSF